MEIFTIKKPFESGYYWYKETLNSKPIIVRIDKSSSLFTRSGFKVLFFECLYGYDLEYREGYWLGPIQPDMES